MSLLSATEKVTTPTSKSTGLTQRTLKNFYDETFYETIFLYLAVNYVCKKPSIMDNLLSHKYASFD